MTRTGRNHHAVNFDNNAAAYPNAAKVVRAMRWLSTYDGWRAGKLPDGTVVVYAPADPLWIRLLVKLDEVVRADQWRNAEQEVAG